MNDPLIVAKNISLDILAFRARKPSLTKSPLELFKDVYSINRGNDYRRILDNVSFTINDGDRLGVLGANGAGKTTLLYVLAGAYKPTSGSLTISGSTHALFDVNVGFKLDATGLENIYLNGLRKGIEFDRLRLMMPDVVNFTGLGDQIYDPIRTYSSGMRLRLAFAVATSVISPNILLMDEWIAAGDSQFIKKARAKLESLVEESKAVILASHRNDLLRDICNKALVLEKGKAVFFEDIQDGLDFYGKKTNNS